MAKVTKRSPAQAKPVKEPEVVVPVQEEAPVVSNFLSADERLKVETMPLSIENAKLRMSVEEQLLKNMILEFKLLEAQIERQKQIVTECHSRYNQEKKVYSATIGEIMKNHNLTSEKFSFNPDTNEIIN